MILQVGHRNFIRVIKIEPQFPKTRLTGNVHDFPQQILKLRVPGCHVRFGLVSSDPSLAAVRCVGEICISETLRIQYPAGMGTHKGANLKTL